MIRMKIGYDHDPENNPRLWDNFGTMVCQHNRYRLGDTVRRVDLNGAHYLPIYLYDHGGITIKTYPFSCPWDSGLVGYIFVEHDKILDRYGDLSNQTLHEVEHCLKREVSIYDLYLRGCVYHYTIEYEDGSIDSCGGYFIEYGDDGLGGILEAIPTEYHALASQAFDNIGEWVEYSEGSES